MREAEGDLPQSSGQLRGLSYMRNAIQSCLWADSNSLVTFKLQRSTFDFYMVSVPA